MLSDGVYVDRASANGGFPVPPESESVRLVASHHDACAGETRVRLPAPLPSRAVRRVVCERCAEPYWPGRIDDLGIEGLSGGRRLSLPSLPQPAWRWVSLPAAAAAVVVGLVLIQSDDDAGTAAPSPAFVQPTGDEASGRGNGNGGAGRAGVPGDARLVDESTFQLALPAGWSETAPSGGATFAAAAPEGDADVMLWIEQDPKLDFASFEARSLAQLESLAGSAGAVKRNLGPTPATTTSLLAPTSAPPDAPNYEVLISGGPNDYWYYLATTSQPGAPAAALDGVKLIQGSFTPLGGKR